MPDQPTHPAADKGPSATLIFVLALATGALVANLYYAQPLVAQIAPAIGVEPDLAGSVVSVTQLGYGLGLFLLVSLADLIENRKLVLVTLTGTIVGLCGMAASTALVPFLISSFLVGLCSTAAQMLLPLTAQLVPAERRGQVIGNVMAGLLTGIMLARPISLFIAASFGWRTVFWCSAVLMAAIGLILARALPRYRPAGGMGYGRVLASMTGLLRDLPPVRWRALYQMLLFAGFNMFWTAVPLALAERFGLGGHGIGLFALAGAGGALAAPIAGRLADRGLTHIATAAAMAVFGLAFYATGWAMAAMALAAMVVLTVIFDGTVQINQVVGQRTIFSVPAGVRGRVNAIYMTITFLGGALGSVLGTVTYHRGGWDLTSGVGGAIGLFALLLLAIELRGIKARHGGG